MSVRSQSRRDEATAVRSSLRARRLESQAAFKAVRDLFSEGPAENEAAGVEVTLLDKEEKTGPVCDRLVFRGH